MEKADYIISQNNRQCFVSFASIAAIDEALFEPARRASLRKRLLISGAAKVGTQLILLKNIISLFQFLIFRFL